MTILPTSRPNDAWLSLLYKLSWLKEASETGYTVLLCFIGISGPEISAERVAMRFSQGGHDVPTDKLFARYPRTLANLKSSIRELPHVLIFDNDDLRTPFRRAVTFERGQTGYQRKPLPRWLTKLLK